MAELGHRLILSIFPGIDLLGRAFEEAGFCIVRGPDLLWGGDIRAFDPPAGVFWGVIGGPPCQDFSSLRRSEPTGYGLEMLEQFRRVVTAAQPEWWLMENVARVPDIEIGYYVTQRLDINQVWYCDVTRLRHVQFGSKSGRLLSVTRRRVTDVTVQSVTDVTLPGSVTPVTRRDTGVIPRGVTSVEGAALASDSRPFRELCRLQGLPDDFDLPPFLMAEKKRAVGNGVPLPMGRALAQAVIDAYSNPVVLQRDLAGGVTPAGRCACGCGREVSGKALYYDFSCRKRAQRKRDFAVQSQ